MARQWNESILMVVLGLLSIGTVLGVSQFFKQATSDKPSSRVEIVAEQMQKMKDDIDSQHRATTHTLEDIESTVKNLKQRVEVLEAATPSPQESTPNRQPSPSSTPRLADDEHGSSIEQALARGREYVARSRFDPKNHDRVLSDLVAAFAVKGLSPGANRSLLATIQEVNEIGVANVISQAQTLPALDATKRLQAFLRSTPRLTPGQRAQVQSALTGISRAGRSRQ